MPQTRIQTKTPIGLTLPIQNSGIGFFEQTYDTFSATRFNIINLLRTRPGERRMQPLFGCRLYNAVFEQNTEILPEYIRNIIKEDVGNWIPNVTVNKVDVKFLKNEESDATDIYRIYVAVSFTVNIINKTDVVEIVIDPRTI
jgi:phage baseplate assembly protein W